MAKTMNTIRLFRRGYDKAPCRNPLVAGQDYIIEVRFQPYFTETGTKMVKVTQVYYEAEVESVRTGPNDWERKTSWSGTVTRDENMTPDEANKVWSYCRSKCTDKIPPEVE